MLLTSTCEVLLPKFIQWTVDLFVQNKHPPFTIGHDLNSLEALNQNLALMLVVMILQALGRLGWRQTLARNGHMIGHKLKQNYWMSLCRQPLSFFQRYSIGDLMSRATSDWSQSRYIYGFNLVITYDFIFFVLLALGSMILIDPLLTFACVLPIPILPRILKNLSREEYRCHNEAQKSLSDLSLLITQDVNSVRLQRATASEGKWISLLNHKAADYAKKRLKTLRVEWKIFPICATATIYSYTVLLTFGVFRVMKGNLSVGEFVAMQSYILLLQSPLLELHELISEWQRGFASYGRVHEVIDLKRNDDEGASAVDIEKCADEALRLTGFTYIYPGSERIILNDINLRVPAGARIGIMGSIGSGKSTLLNSICCFTEEASSKILIFGVRQTDLSGKYVRSQITLIPQRPFLFAGTIRENLTLGETFSDDDIWFALKQAVVADDVLNLEGGLDTLLGERGVNISGGQRQRLTIARAFLRPRPIVLLDDCLSAVDALTEEKIIHNIVEAFSNSTIIWVAHRASTLRACDRLFEMCDGSLERVR